MRLSLVPEHRNMVTKAVKVRAGGIVFIVQMACVDSYFKRIFFFFPPKLKFSAVQLMPSEICVGGLYQVKCLANTGNFMF